MEPLAGVFDKLQYMYVETILASVEKLWYSQQDEVYFIGGGTAGDLWGHQTWSPSSILPRIRNQVKTVEIVFLFFSFMLDM